MARTDGIRPILWAQLDKSQVRPRLNPQPNEELHILEPAVYPGGWR